MKKALAILIVLVIFPVGNALPYNKEYCRYIKLTEELFSDMSRILDDVASAASAGNDKSNFDIIVEKIFTSKNELFKIKEKYLKKTEALVDEELARVDQLNVKTVDQFVQSLDIIVDYLYEWESGTRPYPEIARQYKNIIAMNQRMSAVASQAIEEFSYRNPKVCGGLSDRLARQVLPYIILGGLAIGLGIFFYYRAKENEGFPDE